MTKTKLAVVLAALFIGAGYAPAQTNSTSLSNSMVADLEKLAGDAWGALKGIDFGQGIGVSPFGVYINNGDFGGGLAVEGIETNTPVHLGFAVAALREKVTSANGKTTTSVNWYDGALTISITGTQVVPVLGTITGKLITGPAFDLNTGEAFSQSFANFSKTWTLNKNLSLTIGGGPGYLSKYQNAVAYEGNVTLDWRF
jgi:hypothetical protein